jgi:hypothetical protein
MPPKGSSSKRTLPIVQTPPEGRVAGWRAVIQFKPKPGAPEQLCAGVVTRLTSGEVQSVCAIDPKKAAHLFGEAGHSLYFAAQALCQSLLEHWRVEPDAGLWVPPFEGASLAEVQAFSGRDAESAAQQMLARASTLYTLLEQYQQSQAEWGRGIVSRIKAAIKRDVATRHLHERFNRQIHIGEEAGTLRVDFLGQNFACYFLQITPSARSAETTTERAFGRLYELAALQRFVKKPKRSLGLLDDERPDRFELVMVGEQNDPVQRRVINLVTALADRETIRALPVASAEAAAAHVVQMERLAA